MTAKPETYLSRLYAWLVGLGLLSWATISIILSWRSGLSFFAGFAAITILLGLWHLTVTLGTRGATPRAAIVGVLVILRYALIGGLIYGIMRVLGGRIQLEWAWFFVGVCTFLPSLILNDFTSGKYS